MKRVLANSPGTRSAATRRSNRLPPAKPGPDFRFLVVGSTVLSLASTALPASTALLAGATAQAETTLGLLPLEGAPRLKRMFSEPLRQRLVVVAEHAKVIGPLALQSRLWRSPGIAEAARSAGLRLAAARNSLLGMQRASALQETAQGIAVLLRAGGRYHSPGLLLRLHLARARAFMLRPADAGRAQATLRAARSIGGNVVVHHFSPALAALAEQVNNEPLRPYVPARAELAHLAHAAALDVLVCLSLRPSGGRIAAQLAIFRAEQPDSFRVEQLSFSNRDALDGINEAILQRSGVPLVGLDAKKQVSRAPRAPGRRWYQRWWVWVAAAAVAGAVGATVAATSGGGQDDGAGRILLRFQ